MIYFKLFLTFLKISSFSFGGGLAMLPIIEKEVVKNGWLSTKEFLDIVVVSQMTPGPIVVNSATYVGNSIAGIPGAIFATFGVILPSLIIIISLANLLRTLENNYYKKSFFMSLRPVIISLILYAGIIIAKNTYFINSKINYISIILTLVCLYLIKKTNIHPISIILISAIIGIIIF
ncbi:chromate transporter [Hypnocyclicus thermotrophus]|uniref:Chromate transporter n=1 Tax=Hypnocyclicus thermotrophus TaxID=1627895 RepID=A0AA46E078_9FUSO|nr:chromate transporter [Hypnocyclicus thermotrophus]TDT72272.1 chromate transporter [Hypnocyclicus thermotrophus]